MYETALPLLLAECLDRHFEQLVLDYQQRCYRLALRLSGSPRDAEEITQDTFVKAYKAIASYPPDRVKSLRLQPWLYQIAVNVFRNRVRTHKVHEVALEKQDGTLAAEPHVDGADQPETVAERAETTADLATLVARLPVRYRTAIVLRHVEGMSYADMATALEQSVGTIKSHVHRGTALLRQYVETRNVKE